MASRGLLSEQKELLEAPSENAKGAESLKALSNSFQIRSMKESDQPLGEAAQQHQVAVAEQPPQEQDAKSAEAASSGAGFFSHTPKKINTKNNESGCPWTQSPSPHKSE